jgi:hypothetical protein
MSQNETESPSQRYEREARERQATADAQRAIDLPDFVSHAALMRADFTVDVHTADQFQAVLAAIGGHNNYDPREAADLLGDLVPDAMQVSVEHFVAGPAIYFQVPFTEAQQNKNRGTFAPSTFLTDEQRRQIADAVIAAGRALRADEISTRQGPGEPDVVWNKPGDRPYENPTLVGLTTANGNLIGRPVRATDAVLQRHDHHPGRVRHQRLRRTMRARSGLHRAVRVVGPGRLVLAGARASRRCAARRVPDTCEQTPAQWLADRLSERLGSVDSYDHRCRSTRPVRP